MRVVIGTWARPSPRTDADAICINLRTRVISRGPVQVNLGPTHCKLAALILAGRGAVVEKRELVDVMYCDDPDGGPETDAVGHAIFWLRRHLQQIGVRIEAVWGRGVRAQLDPAEEAVAA